MKRILAILLTVLMIGTVFALTGCSDKDAKQKEYEEIFNDASKIELNSLNFSAVGTNDGSKMMEVQCKESGDMKIVMYLTDDIGYTTYNIGDYSYLEMHIPEYKDSDGNTIKAEDVYYKTNNNDNTEVTAPDIGESLELNKKENVKSVKYIETKTVNGMKCDVVEVVHIIHSENEEISNDVEVALEESDDKESVKDTDKDSESKTGGDDSSVHTTGELDKSENSDTENAATESSDNEGTNSENISSENQSTEVEVTSTFYFVSDTKKLYGYKAISNGLAMECYFIIDLKIELPKDVEFVEASDETINDKMTSLYTAAYSQLDAAK